MLPQPVRQNHDVIFAWLVFLGQKIPAKEERIPQHRVVAGSGVHALEIFGLVRYGNVEIIRRGGFQLLN